ncbi:MAG: peptidoglycan DD-metalloendopeptidase family protein [Bacteroidetes bacterium SB0662_bin_6]|nr:peptidoglycan DD-metalloendopeptidase family protein [Bacteroidetes bacterium SB0668_bin_1]MYE05336.1 peptidoglycan DD-metalloendopeptidase family protein [Bacteroidetes bacterium SB0662_bin_6]
MYRLIFMILLMAALCVALPARAQQGVSQEVLIASGQDDDASDRERQATRQRLAELKAQIAEDKQRLSETTEAEQASLKTLEQLDRQIALHKELIRNYGRRMNQISSEMGALRTTLSTLENELETLKTQYRSRAAHAYKYGRMHDLALIASSKSINQMLVRVRYLHRFAQQRRGRLAEIQTTQEETEARNEQLKDILADNERLLEEERSEQQNLERLHQNRTRVISDLRVTRSTIEQSIERKRAAARDLENRIRELIAATDRDRLRAREDLATAEEYAALSGSFLENRGQLPWPVKGVMREPFGDTVNPVYGTRTRNPGIIIETPSSAEVRAIFDGRIIDISVLPEYGRYVVIEHGVYKTVYSNFSDTFITEGDLVEIGQVIGQSGTPDEPKGTALFFALFKEGSPIDPSPWLAVR